MENQGIIYKITNKINGKVYIGQTVQGLTARLYQHRYAAFVKKSKYPLYNALRKYGESGFTYEIVRYVNKAELNSYEWYYIKMFNSTDSSVGYNATEGGNSSISKLPEIRKKISLARKGQPNKYKGVPRTDRFKKGSKRSEWERKLVSEGLKKNILFIDKITGIQRVFKGSEELAEFLSLAPSTIREQARAGKNTETYSFCYIGKVIKKPNQCKAIIREDLSGNLKTYKSIHELEAEFFPALVRKACRTKSLYKKFKWSYSEEGKV